jgi:hypothetical protein
MFVDIEETLGRELREVADGLQIPAMPPLPQEPRRAQRHWQPLLVAAAAVVLIVTGVAVVGNTRGSQEVQPAPPAPSPSPTESVVRVPKTAPQVPYVLDQELYVDGEQVPGTWWSVRSGDAGWLALRTDNTWWWGRGPKANEITGRHDVPPVISPNGRYVAEVLAENGEGEVTGFDTRPAGEGLGGVPVDLGDPADGNPVTVRAVTDDGAVIVQGAATSLLWLPLVDNSTVDLTETAPGQQFLSGTPAGLVVTDGEGGEPYLAEISEDGELTRVGAVPAHDDLVVSPAAEWLAWTAPGTTSGEVTSIPALEAQTVDASQQATLNAPAGWGFRVRAWVWEDDDHLVSPVVGDGGERMARCSVKSAGCVLVDTH